MVLYSREVSPRVYLPNLGYGSNLWKIIEELNLEQIIMADEILLTIYTSRSFETAIKMGKRGSYQPNIEVYKSNLEKQINYLSENLSKLASYKEHPLYLASLDQSAIEKQLDEARMIMENLEKQKTEISVPPK